MTSMTPYPDSYCFRSYPMCNVALRQGNDRRGNWSTLEVYVSTKPGEWIVANEPDRWRQNAEPICRCELSAYEFGRLVGKGVL